MKYIDRITIQIRLEDLPFNTNNKIKLIDASKLEIIMPEVNTHIDIGSWCYSQRRRWSYTRTSKTGIKMVKESSLLKNRRKFILKYAEYLYIEYKLGKRIRTILSSHSIFQRYIFWCDKYKINSFESLDQLKSSYISYTEDLIKKVKNNKLKLNTASFYQQTVKAFLEFYSNKSDGTFLSGISNIKRDSATTNSTPPPDCKEAEYTLKLYSSLFEEIYIFIIRFKKYPWKLDIGHEKLWVFPNTRPLATKSMLKNRKLWKHKYYAYNFENGSINDYQTTLQKQNILSSRDKRYVTESIASAKKKIIDANTDEFHPRRILLATLAQQSFIMMFSVNTGMNLSSISSLIWNSKDFEINKTSQGFKTIKSRASNKETTFVISSKFYSAFKKYLKLRDYLISSFKNTDCDLLFFRIKKGELYPLEMNTSYYYNNRIKRLFDIDINLGTRSWRSHKSDWLIKNTDIYTTSLILQNTPETVIRSYITGSETQATEEFSDFFKLFTKKSIIKKTTNTTNTSVGRCKKINSPNNNTNSSTIIEPNCKQPEGCLFCIQYAIVADEEDIRKLLSLKYIIRESRSIAFSDSHFDSIFGKVNLQIQHIIRCLKKTGNHIEKLILRVESEINEEERLSPYWERKLKLLSDLEVITP